MATPIRPALPQIPASRPAGGPGEATRAAQRAFFSQALNAAQSSAIPAEAPVAETAPVAPVSRRTAPERADIPPEQPARSVRPGSYLDIKV